MGEGLVVPLKPRAARAGSWQTVFRGRQTTQEQEAEASSLNLSPEQSTFNTQVSKRSIMTVPSSQSLGSSHPARPRVPSHLTDHRPASHGRQAYQQIALPLPPVLLLLPGCLGRPAGEEVAL